MSSLWTPGGEHKIERPRPQRAPEAADAPELDREGEGTDDAFAEAIDPEAAKQMAAELEAARRELASVPAQVVVANHVMGLYELAAIHLTRQPPNLSEAVIAIDAVGAIVEGLAGRLGEAEPTLRDALANIRMAFVQIKGSTPA